MTRPIFSQEAFANRQNRLLRLQQQRQSRSPNTSFQASQTSQIRQRSSQQQLFDNQDQQMGQE